MSKDDPASNKEITDFSLPLLKKCKEMEIHGETPYVQSRNAKNN